MVYTNCLAVYVAIRQANAIWLDLCRPGYPWLGLAWLDLAWHCLALLGLLGMNLVGLGLVGPRLGLAELDLEAAACCTCVGLARLGLPRLRFACQGYAGQR